MLFISHPYFYIDKIPKDGFRFGPLGQRALARVAATPLWETPVNRRKAAFWLECTLQAPKKYTDILLFFYRKILVRRAY